MKKLFLIVAAAGVLFGCARVRVEAPKEPIKVDIAMRLDIYQHVQKDIDAIENIVTGDQGAVTKPSDKQSFLGFFLASAYAQEGMNPEVEQAALRRRDRLNELRALESKGVIGESKMGLVEARGSSAGVEQLISAENSDRMLIYKSVAAKNNTTVEEVQKLYAERLRNSAPSGTPLEVLNEASGLYEWKAK